MNTPDYLPFQIYGRKAEHALGSYPEGFYLIELTDCSKREARTSAKLGDYQQRIYEGKIKMGPNNSQEWAGRKMYDRIPELEQFGGRHMELFAAVFGSEAAVNDIATKHQGQFAPDMCRTGHYVAEVAVDKNGYSNVVNRYPASKWGELVGAGQAQSAPGGLLQPSAPTPAPAAAPAFIPPAPNFPVPTAAAPVPPAVPSFPAPGAPAFPAPPVPGAAPVAPSVPGMPAFPAPPPVPGVPAQ